MAFLRSNIADLVPLLLFDSWSGEEKHHKNMEDRTLDHFGLENTIDYFLSNHVDGWPFGLSNQREGALVSLAVVEICIESKRHMIEDTPITVKAVITSL